jgi:hypothetical protein
VTLDFPAPSVTFSTRIPLTGIHIVKMTEDLFETARLFLISLGETNYSESLDDYLVYFDGRIVALIQTAEMGQGSGETGTTARNQTMAANSQLTPAKPLKGIFTKKPEQADQFKSRVLAELMKKRPPQ